MSSSKHSPSEILSTLKKDFPGWDGELPDDACDWTKDDLYMYAGSSGYIRPERKKNTSSSIPLPKEVPVITTPSTDNSDKGVGRWFFNIDNWQPSAQEWELSLQLLPSEEDVSKCTKFIFEKDRKLALGSRLLQRYAVREGLGLQDSDFKILRTKERKPVLDTSSLKVQNAMQERGYINFNINATHHGCIVAVSTEPIMATGIDVMNMTEMVGNAKNGIENLFTSFQKDFCQNEWNYIHFHNETPPPYRTRNNNIVEEDEEKAKLSRFYLIWTLKEAYIKAHGLGLGIKLSSINFFRRYPNEQNDHEWGVYVNDREPKPKWTFYVQKLDEYHVVCVARAPPQHCHDGFAQYLTLPTLTTEQCEIGTLLHQPRFIEVPFCTMIDPLFQETLFKLRYPNFHLNFVDNQAQWCNRWKKWLFKRPPPPPAPLAPHDKQQQLSTETNIPITITAAAATDATDAATATDVTETDRPNPNVDELSSLNGLKIYQISDVHTDYRTNMTWLEKLSKYPKGSYLILAGDISHDVKVIETTLSLFKSKFDEVFYTFGNHELWMTKKDLENNGDVHSLDKVLTILELCDRLNVRTRPTIIQNYSLQHIPPTSTSTSTTKPLVIIPLFAWYHSNLCLQHSDNLNHTITFQNIDRNCYNQLSSLEKQFDCQCKWPQKFNQFLMNQGVSQSSNNIMISTLFAELNEQVFEQCGYPLPTYRNNTGGRMKDSLVPKQTMNIISFSHFIPDSRLYPGRRDLIHVMGSMALQKQVLFLKPNIHTFGHSHITINQKLNEYPCDTYEENDGNSNGGVDKSDKTLFIQSFLGKTYPDGSGHSILKIFGE